MASSRVRCASSRSMRVLRCSSAAISASILMPGRSSAGTVGSAAASACRTAPIPACTHRDTGTESRKAPRSLDARGASAHALGAQPMQLLDRLLFDRLHRHPRDLAQRAASISAPASAASVLWRLT